MWSRNFFNVLERESTPNEILIEEYTKVFESGTSAGATEKLPGWEKPHAKTIAWSYDMEGNARKCVEWFCELANKKVEQLYKLSTPFIDDHQRRRNEICWRVVRSWLPHFIKVLVPGTNWETWHSTVCQQTCKSSHKMFSGMRRAIGKIDFVHSPHKWLPTRLSSG